MTAVTMFNFRLDLLVFKRTIECKYIFVTIMAKRKTSLQEKWFDWVAALFINTSGWMLIDTEDERHKEEGGPLCIGF